VIVPTAERRRNARDRPIRAMHHTTARVPATTKPPVCATVGTLFEIVNAAAPDARLQRPQPLRRTGRASLPL